MSTDLTNFRSWYADTLALLAPHRDCGIAMFMITLPLLERYLRQKNGRRPAENLNDSCMATLRGLFPTLINNPAAWQFWNVYRNGFLHQATLSLQSKSGTELPTGWLSHDKPRPLLVESDGSFWVNPVLFSEVVVQTIESDFAVFSGASTPAPPLPTVIAHVAPDTGEAIPPVYLGTKGGP